MAEYVAIVRRRAVDWYLSVPAVGLGAPLWRPAEAVRLAVRLVRLRTGRDLPESAVGVLTAGPEDLYLPAGRTEVEARHTDGRWHRGQLAGWVRQSDDTWQAVVCYPVAGVLWERVLAAGRWRPAAATEQAGTEEEPGIPTGPATP
ncbi:hypothetical protein ACI79C_20465 [Geodermatophilus sp. SYSU D00697]